AVLLFSIPLSIKALVGGMLVASFVEPAAGLLGVAALAPLGRLIATSVGLERFRIGEALTLAFLIGWLPRGQRDRRGPVVPATVGWLLAATVVASVAGITLRATSRPGEIAHTLDFLFYLYFQIQDRLGFVDGARLLEGVALMVATVTLFR